MVDVTVDEKALTSSRKFLSIRIKEGLPYVALCPYTDTDNEWPCNLNWDPAIFDHEFDDDDDDEWNDSVMDHRDLFDEIGNYRNRKGVVAEEHILELASSLQDYVDEGMVVNMCIHHSRQLEVNESQLHFQAHQVKPGDQDWETLHQFFDGPMLNK